MNINWARKLIGYTLSLFILSNTCSPAFKGRIWEENRQFYQSQRWRFFESAWLKVTIFSNGLESSLHFLALTLQRTMERSNLSKGVLKTFQKAKGSILRIRFWNPLPLRNWEDKSCAMPGKSAKKLPIKRPISMWHRCARSPAKG